MPPLRERREDILPLFAHFLADRKQGTEMDAYAVSDPIRRHLMEHNWPGNVRELRNFALSTLVNAPDVEPAATPSPQSLTDRVDAFEAGYAPARRVARPDRRSQNPLHRTPQKGPLLPENNKLEKKSSGRLHFWPD